MGNVLRMVALDCGNSSFRTVMGEYRDGRIVNKVISQTPNGMVKIGDYYYWDFLKIFSTFKQDLKTIAAEYGHIDSVGIATWGVDFALFDKDGHMISNPLSYRNTIGEKMIGNLSEEEKKEIFNETGILCDKINSVYMMAGMKEHFPVIFENASRLLMVPDVFNYFLTGEMVNEPSELSTTQLMDACTQKINPKICEKFGIPESFFGKIGEHGKLIGYVKKDILEEIGVDYDIPVVCVPSHDTGAAVAAIPAAEEPFAFISCGTWSLIGAELKEPIINEAIMEANLTNEVGALGRITLLRNNAGMFIVNELKKEYDFKQGRKVSWDEITEMAENCTETVVFDINDAAFFNPISMSEALWKYLTKTGQVSGKLRWEVLFRAFYETLACAYAEVIHNIEKITGQTFEKVYIVGGGSASRILLNLSSRHLGKPMVACEGESTSMGNVAFQLKYFKPELSLSDLREIIGASGKKREICVEPGGEDILAMFRKLSH
ncbi:MAG: FGGY family carbohydrate kinase [Lachnospiraceae bacterium]|nr:FGGY family carbohydrate kinase [Lachnospiraceae bacterium]